MNGEPWRVFATRGAKRDIHVYVGEQIDSRDSILQGMLRGLLAPLLVALPLMALLLWWAVRRGLLPLHRIGQAIAQREPQALAAHRGRRRRREHAQRAGAAGGRAERPVRAHRHHARQRAAFHRRRSARTAHADRGDPRPGPGGTGRGWRRGRPPACAGRHADRLRPRDAPGRAVAHAGAVGVLRRRAQRRGGPEPCGARGARRAGAGGAGTRPGHRTGGRRRRADARQRHAAVGAGAQPGRQRAALQPRWRAHRRDRGPPGRTARR